MLTAPAPINRGFARLFMASLNIYDDSIAETPALVAIAAVSAVEAVGIAGTFDHITESTTSP